MRIAISLCSGQPRPNTPRDSKRQVGCNISRLSTSALSPTHSCWRVTIPRFASFVPARLKTNVNEKGSPLRHQKHPRLLCAIAQCTTSLRRTLSYREVPTDSFVETFFYRYIFDVFALAPLRSPVLVSCRGIRKPDRGHFLNSSSRLGLAEWMAPESPPFSAS